MSLAPGTKKYQYPVRETTQWEDILVEKKIWEADEKLVSQKQALEESRQRGELIETSTKERIVNAKTDLDDLDRLEDEAIKDDDDERMLARFRAARIAEMKKQAIEARFGSVETLARDEFMVKVKEASSKGGIDNKPMFVIVELFREGLERSALVSLAVNDLAKQHPSFKFVRMVSDQCIQGWPDSRVPTIIIYFDGEMKHQLIGLEECGSGSMNMLAKILWKRGVLPKPEHENDEERGLKRSEVEDW